MLDKFKKTANSTLEKSKEITSASLDKSKEITDASIKYGKKFIRKKAIENIREKLEFAQKKESDFTKEQMREMIQKEEKKVIKSFGVNGALTTILALFGISNF
ncbi:MAG: hypothetical protein ISQ17_04050 [Pelagibacteraceae bacterium]|jgi:hypothetical protein|nr:hypothetical protein [Pelagibacteraceae bacterium]MDC1077005.1 hypothetical protein [Candidatus Pelagibacter sp.]|tara:strand:- start:536 stop:844 length:309 start_codon:yes stop_codon:yes gene_type:complete